MQPMRIAGLVGAPARIINVSEEPRLTISEFVALQEIGRGTLHATIPSADAMRLLELKLAYRLLGDIRITVEGRKRLRAGR